MKEKPVEVILPKSEKERYMRYTFIFNEFRKMTLSDPKASNNKKYTQLAAKYKMSIASVRNIVEKYLSDYPL